MGHCDNIWSGILVEFIFGWEVLGGYFAFSWISDYGIFMWLNVAEVHTF